ncbi:MAG: glycosyltransferase [Clostridia bacterium]|nr:glycosyltransferase [Clostridia bacterium]
MKNILIIANNGMGNSGVPNVICQVIDAQYKKCRISLLVFNDDDFYYPFLKERNVNIIKLKIEPPKTSFKKLIWYFWTYPRILFKKSTEIIKNNKIDIIHSFKEEEGWSILKAGKRNNVKIRITHCNNEFRKRVGFISEILAKYNRRELLKYSSCNIGVCEKCCLSMFKNKPYSIIYNSYNETKFNNAVKCKLKDEMVLTHVATFSSRKNQLFSIEVLEAIVRQGNKCKLNLVGFPVEVSYLEDIKASIKSKKLEDFVSIIDGRNGVGDIFESTTFFLLPSISEAAPISLVEAQACGISCFASDTITREMDCGGVTFLPINNASQIWAEKIIKTFSTNKNKRNVYDITKFSSDTFTKSIDRIYNL